jgi:hypothetical protein
MPELHFQVESAEPNKLAAASLLLFKLRIHEAASVALTTIHSIVLPTWEQTLQHLLDAAEETVPS